ncbi:MAG: serine/threonine-protein kinase [Pyrobaculum sp.]
MYTTLAALMSLVATTFLLYQHYMATMWVTTSIFLILFSVGEAFLINSMLITLVVLRGVFERFKKELVAAFVVTTLIKMYLLTNFYLEEKLPYVYYITDAIFTSLSIFIMSFGRKLPEIRRATWPAVFTTVLNSSLATPLSLASGVVLALGDMPPYFATALLLANLMYLYLGGDPHFFLPPLAFGLAYFLTYRKTSYISPTPPLGWLYSWLGGRYRVLRVLGAGGFSYVLAVRHRGVTYAAKVLRYRDDYNMPLAGDENILAAFGQEMNKYLGIKSHHVVRAYEVYLPAVPYRDVAQYMKNPPYILLEYMDGGTLRERLRAVGRLPLREALEMFKQLAGGLYDIHRHNVVHLDIKPENIMFRDKLVKIGDMGIAKVITGSYVYSSYMSPAYAAPEVKRGQATYASDIYSLGCVIYEALTGINPNVFMENRHQIPPPSTYNREVPPWLDRLLLKMLAADPAERPTAAELVTFLKRAVEVDNAVEMSHMRHGE